MSDDLTGRELTPREPGSEVAPREDEPAGRRALRRRRAHPSRRADRGALAHRSCARAATRVGSRSWASSSSSSSSRSTGSTPSACRPWASRVTWSGSARSSTSPTSRVATRSSRRTARPATASTARAASGRRSTTRWRSTTSYTPTGDPGTGHLNPNYITAVLQNGGRLRVRRREERDARLGAARRPAQLPPDRGDRGLPRARPTRRPGPTCRTPPRARSARRRSRSTSTAGATRTSSRHRAPRPTRPAGATRTVRSSAARTRAAAARAAARSTRRARRTSRASSSSNETGTLQITDPAGTRARHHPGRGRRDGHLPGDQHGRLRPQLLPRAGRRARPRPTTSAPDLPGIPTFASGTQELTYTFETTDPLQFACTLPGHYGSMHGDFEFVK